MSDRPKYPDGSVVMDEHVTAEYVAQLAAEADARVAAAYEAAAEIAADKARKLQRKLNSERETGRPNVKYRIARAEMDAWQSIRDTIRALATDAQSDALERVRAEERERGFWIGRRCGGRQADIDAALAAIREGGE